MNAVVYAMERDQDVSGVSGVGRVAYAIELPSGVLLVWDTEWVTVDWRPNMQVLEAIHGHNGATRIVRLSEHDDPAGWWRAMELLAGVQEAALRTLSEAGAVDPTWG